MRCLHPHCKTASHPGSWTDVAAHPDLKVKLPDQPGFAAALDAAFGPLATPAVARPVPPMPQSRLKALLRLCPCLFNQIEMTPTPRAVVHFCEMTLGAPIVSANVHAAFLVQHPKGPTFNPPLLESPKDGGTIMEMLCSEVLTNEGIQEMPLKADKWPDWVMPGHVLLNEGGMSALKAFGDILVPCAPTNIVISVKSEAARERLLYSANSIEGVGFGFFNQPQEFWTRSRMTLYKRMGFSAIYMPDETHAAIMARLAKDGTTAHSVNINGGNLYRPLTQFGEDMNRVVGRSSTLL